MYESEFPMKYVGDDCITDQVVILYGDYVKIIDATPDDQGRVEVEHYWERDKYRVPESLIRRRTE